MFNIGIQSYAHAAQLQEEWEREHRGDMPTCERCGNEYDASELFNGVCEDCALDEYDLAKGQAFIAEHVNEWHYYLAGEDPDTLPANEYAELVHEFCTYEMKDEFLRWLDV